MSHTVHRKGSAALSVFLGLLLTLSTLLLTLSLFLSALGGAGAPLGGHGAGRILVFLGPAGTQRPAGTSFCGAVDFMAPPLDPAVLFKPGNLCFGCGHP